MTAQEKQFSLSVEIRQLEESILSVFQTIFLHRTSGKFHFTSEHTYSVGTLGFLDVPCDTVNFTYVKLASGELEKNIVKHVRQFRDMLLDSADTTGSASGEITLEFYQKRKSRWLFVSDSVPWEVWSVRVKTFRAADQDEWQLARNRAGEALVDAVFDIAESINAANRHVPQTPTQSELETVFDTTYSDVQPFVFRVRYGTERAATTGTTTGTGTGTGTGSGQGQAQGGTGTGATATTTGNTGNGSVGNTVKKLIQNTLLA